MCASCVAQGAAYVGGAVAGLQVMAARARHHRIRAANRSESSTATGGAAAADGVRVQPATVAKVTPS